MDKKEKEFEAMIESAPADMPKEVIEQAVKAVKENTGIQSDTGPDHEGISGIVGSGKVVKEAKQASKEEEKEAIKWFWNSFKQGTYKRTPPKPMTKKRLKKVKQKEARAVPLPKGIHKVNAKKKYNSKKTQERLLAKMK